jgi:hypothetical protein
VVVIFEQIDPQGFMDPVNLSSRHTGVGPLREPLSLRHSYCVTASAKNSAKNIR